MGVFPPYPRSPAVPRGQAGIGHPEVFTAGGSKAGARLASLSRVAPVVVCEGAESEPQFLARQSLVTRGRGGPGARGVWGGLPVCFYASCPKTAARPPNNTLISRPSFLALFAGSGLPKAGCPHNGHYLEVAMVWMSSVTTICQAWRPCRHWPCWGRLKRSIVEGRERCVFALLCH
jgi:hypothetical protein